MSRPRKPQPDEHPFERALQRNISQVRRTIALSSPRDFARVYLSKALYSSEGRMQEELWSILDSLEDQRLTRFALAAPRAHAKSTIVSLAYIMWLVLSGKEKFVVFISSTADRSAPERACRGLERRGDARPTDLLTQALTHPRPARARPLADRITFQRCEQPRDVASSCCLSCCRHARRLRAPAALMEQGTARRRRNPRPSRRPMRVRRR